MHGETVFIVNPSSAAGLTKGRFNHVHETALSLFPNAAIIETQGPGHATVITREKLQAGSKTIIAVGGDGTYNEVVNGFIDANGKMVAQDAKFGMLMSGTGADFCRSFRHETNLEQDLKRLKNGKVNLIDIGRATATGTDGRNKTRYFINAASLGMSALAAEILNNSPGKFGKFAYFLAGLRALIGFHPQNIRVHIDGEPMSYPALSMMAFANGQYFGGGMHIAPNARLDDGFFDQVAVSRMGVLFFLRHGPSVYNGRHVKLPQVSIRRSRQASIEAAEYPVVVEIDGEPFGQLPAKFEILPKLLPIII